MKDYTSKPTVKIRNGAVEEEGSEAGEWNFKLIVVRGVTWTTMDYLHLHQGRGLLQGGVYARWKRNLRHKEEGFQIHHLQVMKFLYQLFPHGRGEMKHMRGVPWMALVYDLGGL